MSYIPSLPAENQSLQPKVVFIKRTPNQGFGFTLRHFIAYPPEDDTSWLEKTEGGKNEFNFPYYKRGMETIFIKEVHPNSPAYHANLKTGDRILMVNQTPIAGLAYSTIVSMIKQSPVVLTLHVVPKECDILQMHYETIAHTSETNRYTLNACSENVSAGRIHKIGMHEEKKCLSPREVKSPPHNILKDEFTYAPVACMPRCSLDMQISLYKDGEIQKQSASYFSSQQHINTHASIPESGHNPNKLYSIANGTYKSDSMVRLRESIKQKEEFLKSAALENIQKTNSHFPDPIHNTSDKLVLKSSSASLIKVNQSPAIYNKPLQLGSPPPHPTQVATSSFGSLASPAYNMYSIPNRSAANCPELNERVQNISLNSYEAKQVNLYSEISERRESASTANDNNNPRMMNVRNGNSSLTTAGDLIHNTGVINKVFERKLAMRFPKGFDPFKELSINTNPETQDEPHRTFLKYNKTMDLSQPTAVSTTSSENTHIQYYSEKDNFVPMLVASKPIDQGAKKSEFTQRLERQSTAQRLSNDSPKDEIKGDNEVVVVQPTQIQTVKAEICRRSKPLNISASDDKNKYMRRISYLRATNNLDHSETSTPIKLDSLEHWNPIDAIELVSSTDEVCVKASSDKLDAKSNFQTEFSEHSSNLKWQQMEKDVVDFELEMKSTYIYGKRSSEFRSWKTVKVEIKADTFTIIPSRNSKPDHGIINLNLKDFLFCDDDKKKNVFRMYSKPVTGQIPHDGDKLLKHSPMEGNYLQTDILFKAKNYEEMKRIFGLLQWKSSLLNENEMSADEMNSGLPSGAGSLNFNNPNLAESSTSSSTTKYDTDVSNSTSPSIKTRKASTSKQFPEQKELGSPKSKNWKDLLFRRSGVGSSNAEGCASGGSSVSKISATGSIGVPLKNCPMSKNNEYLPRIVEVCTEIVESKGLDIIGIYRIPGNKAAISELSEQVNKIDFSWDQCTTDVRWEDVNVVSSLLKLFIRSLPDALLPSSFYGSFIEADKKTGLVRIKDIKDLLTALPNHSYETLKHLIRHLSRISQNCDVNLMEPKNLAIIFGPSIIRTTNDTLEIAVKDMKHQCRIVELLVSQYEYFFENGELPTVLEAKDINKSTSEETSESATNQEDQTNILLHNVSKIERLNEKEVTRSSRFIPQLRRRNQNKRRGASSDTYSGESVLSLETSKPSSSVENSDVNAATTTSFSTASSSSSYMTATAEIKSTQKKKERLTFLVSSSRSNFRKMTMDEKSSESWSKTSKMLPQRNSVDVSVFLTDDESPFPRLSDSESMSLTTITDTLDTKLKNLRSGSESNDENESPDYQKSVRHNLVQPLNIHSENIPFADESPERQYPLEFNWSLVDQQQQQHANLIATANVNANITSNQLRSNKNNIIQHSLTTPMPIYSSSSMHNPNHSSLHQQTKFGGSIQKSSSLKNSSAYMGRQKTCSDDDSECSTTSNPKESLTLKQPIVIQERYNKKRRDHRLCRSASFNCRNHLVKIASVNMGQQISSNSAGVVNLTKDEKTDMNLTKKRQIQIKQNRSIKRRHTVGGPHDYETETTANNTNCNQCSKRYLNRKSSSRRISVANENGAVVAVGAGVSSGVNSGAATNINNLNNNNKNKSVCEEKEGQVAAVMRSGSGDHILDALRNKSINKLHHY